MNKSVLVTGADGFIGSHLVEQLIRAGHDVTAFVMYNSFNSFGWLDSLPADILGSIKVFPGDIRDPNGVQTAMVGAEVILHLAALIGIPYSYHSPSTYVETNIIGTLNVLQSAKNIGVGQVIHTSTSEVYGTAQYVPIDENHPLDGQSPYSASKIGADQMALAFYRSFGTPVSVIRPFITQIGQGNSAIQLGSIHPTRDFTFVTDTAKGFMSAIDNDASIGQVINLGSGFEISVGDTVKEISSIMGAEVSITQDNSRLRPEKSEVERLWADNSKAAEILDWAPTYAGIEGFRFGLIETIKWFGTVENTHTYKTNRYNI